MQHRSVLMESQLSLLSSLNGELRQEEFIQPHYKESYRLAIDALVSDGQEKYQEVLKTEQIGDFLSEQEVLFLRETASHPPATTSPSEENDECPDNTSSSGTYWPMHSDVETPDLDLGWPEFLQQDLHTNIDLLFHPPRLSNPTIKEVIRKHILDARQVIAVVMDIFTDVDIFKELVDASVRGIAVYVLLDDFGLQGFLTMAEKQDVQIQRLRNMRVRTVKGQEYLCRSGARIHGAMEQKFLLVDCHTVLFGSYSFTWSYEKIHLSMVQVITGQLVQLYDEEFRTLFARSTVPTVLLPPEGHHNGHGPGLGAGFKAQCGQTFERSDQLRHTLDTVYMRACGKAISGKITMGDWENEPFNGVLYDPRPAYDHSASARALLQPDDALGYLKRHSYAGERQESSFVPNHAKYGASNWNVSGDGAPWYGAPGRNEHPLQLSRMAQGYGRGSARQSFHGNDKHVLSMQQNLPSLERTAKSFLRTWRIESYLNSNEAPLGESAEYLDQYEALDCKHSSYMHSRLRSSLIFKSTIPEQPETNSNSHNSSSAGTINAPTTMPFYSSMQWQPPPLPMDSRTRQDDFLLKRRSLQILDDPRNILSFPVRDQYQSAYASLGRAKGGLLHKTQEVLQEDRFKRHSVADPRMHGQYFVSEESPRQVYGPAGPGPADRRVLDERALSRQHLPNNLKEEQRSLSHHDFKEVKGNSLQPPMWQEPPSRTVSVSALSVSDKVPPHKSSNLGSPHFFKKSTKKIKSLLNIPEKEKKGGSNKFGSNVKVAGSSDTLLSEDQGQMGGKERNAHLLVKENHFANSAGKSSTPRFSTEDLEQNCDVRWQGEHAVGFQKDRTSVAAETRPRNHREDQVYSRFEPFCALEKKRPPSDHSRKLATNTQALERTRTVVRHSTRGSSPGDHYNSTGCATQTPNDNKLGRFIQRMGHLLHKNK
ncbi:hypothetical protein AAFF_G00317650 [Aldrovandia affinis]|uniref:Scaffolding anchor of CK1 domain-containing protein n=1 Tax=Aldrovandia affinis TaxID=143900 RepID=A0AAD7VZQ8_9TELE|nr:hypothetical protein AAFF_G00317650 [Aldrovandia affinis]